MRGFKANAFLTIFGLILGAAPAFGAPTCADLFAPPSIFEQSQSLLSSFSVRELDVRKTQSLGSESFLVETRGGVKYVVRLALDPDQSRFEKFASVFINGSRLGRAAEIRVLSKLDSAALMSQIRSLGPPVTRNFEREIEDTLSDYGPETKARLEEALRNPDVTVTPYLEDLQLGENFLAEKFISDPVRQFLADAGNGTAVTNRELKQSRQDYTDEQKRILFEDLKDLLTRDQLDKIENFDSLFENWQQNRKTRIVELDVYGLKRMPPELLESLSDSALLWAVLGIHDFHPANWMTNGRSIVSIDTAALSGVFTRGDANGEFRGQLSPFGHFHLDRSDRAWSLIYANASASMRSFLIALDRSRLVGFGEAAGMTLEAKAIEGILARAEFFLKRISDSKKGIR